MSDDGTLVLKVICGSCGAKVGEVYDRTEGGLRFRPAQAGRGDSFSSGRFWCLEHGWTRDGEVEEVARKASRGKVATHRARMGLWVDPDALS